MLARPLFFGKKLIVQVSHPRLLYALLIREHAVGFFVTAVMSLFSEFNAHCEVAEVLTMPRPRKLYRGLSQCRRTCGHGNSGSVSQCGRREGGLAKCEHFLESEKTGN